MPLFKELTGEENIEGNPHTLQEPKETISQNLPVHQDQDFNEGRNIFTMLESQRPKLRDSSHEIM